MTAVAVDERPAPVAEQPQLLELTDREADWRLHGHAAVDDRDGRPF
jgi:hypothetical protein